MDLDSLGERMRCYTFTHDTSFTSLCKFGSSFVFNLQKFCSLVFILICLEHLLFCHGTQLSNFMGVVVYSKLIVCGNGLLCMADRKSVV